MHRLYTLFEETQRISKKTRINPSPHTTFDLIASSIVISLLCMNKNIEYTRGPSPHLFGCGYYVQPLFEIPQTEGD